MTDLADLTLVEAADAIRNGDATSLELLNALLDNLDAVNTQINATIWLDRDGAEKAAHAADKAVREKAWLGPLHGVPMAHKDMYYQAGKLSTAGSALRRDFRPTVTATVIEKLSEAGAYTFGGLNMAEFAQNPTGHNKTFGDCHNPWNLPYITGGSSSGSGVSVAARCNYMALGSDTGGSIRLPAAACGVTGIKPTQTRVSRYGVMPLSFSADNVGPLCRTARDCARIMNVIAGHDPRDPTSSHLPVPDYEGALDGDLRGLRIGVPTTYFLDGADAPVLAAMETALAVLAARGAQVQRITLPLMDAVAAYAGIISRVEGATIHAQWMRTSPQEYGGSISGRMYPAYAIPATYYVEALSRRGPILRAFAAEVFGKVDVLVTPTIRTNLPTLAETSIEHGPPGTEHRFLAVSANTRPFNYLGLPAVGLNCGFDPNGCPIGLQIAGRPFAEARVLKVADAYQCDTDWHKRQPPVLQMATA
ncbi:MAG TPA: amidase [Acetobacteraceae bacterium]|jgi:aspartyl-tRNA(Asn)/glutamyl-tRNA(Gln) amidotransferase subunit A